ncbi:MAG TPA: H-type small acid-soluble spore protein [Lachnospiraceae bacterium]|nr:H-type small acid-soluble spore protein [Lachnospiraceae bacterium]
MMDGKRAQDIISSTGMIKVTYNGTPIYIDSVNTGSNTARIHPMNDPNRMEEVSLDKLEG